MKRAIQFILVLCSVALLLVGLVTALQTPPASADRPYPDAVEPLDKDTPSNIISPIPEEDIPESSAPEVEEPEETYEGEYTIPEPIYDYTEEELDLLARLIYSEGGIESYETQLKIGSVVMNRVLSEDPWFPDTIREVIYQKNQFSVTFILKDGVPMIDQPADEEAKRAAYEVLTYGSVLPPDVQVFFHKSITTGWVATREPYGTFDHTTFAYIYERGSK